jgi:hypothetical protein
MRIVQKGATGNSVRWQGKQVVIAKSRVCVDNKPIKNAGKTLINVLLSMKCAYFSPRIKNSIK